MAALSLRRCSIVLVLLLHALSSQAGSTDKKVDFLLSKMVELESEIHELKEKMKDFEADKTHEVTNNQNVAVAFSSYATASRGYSAGAKVLFDGIITNLGENFDGEVFTCPAAGLYLFFTNIYTSKDQHVEVELILENGPVLTKAAAPSSDGADNGSTMAISTCEAGQRVWCNVMRSGTISGTFSVFSGVQLAS